MSELLTLEQKAIERIKAFEPEEGYYLAFSGGKDSVVCKALLDMANVKYDATYRVTSVDPPELVRFIKNSHPDVIRQVPRDRNGKPITMWNLIPRKLMPPTRLVRYCCYNLKESGGDGRLTVTGVRWAESVNRKKSQGIVTMPDKSAPRTYGDNPDFRATKQGGMILVNDNDDSRRMVEQCYKRHKTTLNPIIEWKDTQVWEFIKAHKIPVCKLYFEGWHRLGCIGCPMATKKERQRQFRYWPKYKQHYLKAFDRMLSERERRSALLGSWKTGTSAQEVFNWWMGYDVLPGQVNLFEEELYESTESDS